MRAYSEDLRKKIVTALEQRGMSKAEAARTFDVSLSSVKRYARSVRRGGSLTPKKSPGRPRIVDEKAQVLLQQVATILICPRFDAPWADQTGSTSSPHMRIMRYGSCPLKPAVKEDVKERPAATIGQRRRFLEHITATDMSDSTVRRLMKRLGFSQKNGQWGRWNETSS